MAALSSDDEPRFPRQYVSLPRRRPREFAKPGGIIEVKFVKGQSPGRYMAGPLHWMRNADIRQRHKAHKQM